MNNFKIFIKNLTITSFIASCIYLIFFIIDKNHYLAIFPFVIIFFYVITLSVHYFLSKSLKDRIAKFSVNFMITTTIKLIIYASFVIIYLLFNKNEAITFVVFFIINYLIFTIFEVVSILRELKKQ